ncbi:MAG: gliding motility-associated C-terminal domain-containing protein [Bacteroidales bacterium]|nr:gliding motility-associated C-terminal domain-containing protein [Bacteroidales bacterium]
MADHQFAATMFRSGARGMSCGESEFPSTPDLKVTVWDTVRAGIISSTSHTPDGDTIKNVSSGTPITFAVTVGSNYGADAQITNSPLWTGATYSTPVPNADPNDFHAKNGAILTANGSGRLAIQLTVGNPGCGTNSSNIIYVDIMGGLQDPTFSLDEAEVCVNTLLTLNINDIDPNATKVRITGGVNWTALDTVVEVNTPTASAFQTVTLERPVPSAPTAAAYTHYISIVAINDVATEVKSADVIRPVIVRDTIKPGVLTFGDGYPEKIIGKGNTHGSLMLTGVEGAVFTQMHSQIYTVSKDGVRDPLTDWMPDVYSSSPAPWYIEAGQSGSSWKSGEDPINGNGFDTVYFRVYADNGICPAVYSNIIKVILTPPTGLIVRGTANPSTGVFNPAVVCQDDDILVSATVPPAWPLIVDTTTVTWIKEVFELGDDIATATPVVTVFTPDHDTEMAFTDVADVPGRYRYIIHYETGGTANADTSNWVRVDSASFGGFVDRADGLTDAIVVCEHGVVPELEVSGNIGNVVYWVFSATDSWTGTDSVHIDHASPTFTPSSETADNTGWYRAAVKNGDGSCLVDLSTAIYVEIITAPTVTITNDPSPIPFGAVVTLDISTSTDVINTIWEASLDNLDWTDPGVVTVPFDEIIGTMYYRVIVFNVACTDTASIMIQTYDELTVDVIIDVRTDDDVAIITATGTGTEEGNTDFVSISDEGTFTYLWQINCDDVDEETEWNTIANDDPATGFVVNPATGLLEVPKEFVENNEDCEYRVITIWGDGIYTLIDTTNIGIISLEAPVIVTPINDGDCILEGETAIYSFEVLGAADVYTWYIDGEIVTAPDVQTVEPTETPGTATITFTADMSLDGKELKLHVSHVDNPEFDHDSIITICILPNDFEITVDDGFNPVVTTVDTVCINGSPYGFTVETANDPSLITYEWFVNESPFDAIPGETANLYIPDATVAGDFEYGVRIIVNAGEMNEATVTIAPIILTVVDSFPMQAEYPMDVELCLDSDEAELSTGVTAAMFDQIEFYTIKWFDADGELPQYEGLHTITIELGDETHREFYFIAESNACGETVQSRTATVAQKGIKDAEMERQAIELGEIICFDGTPFDLTYDVTLDLVNIIAGEETNIWMVDGVIQAETGTSFVYNVTDMAQNGTVITYGVVYGTCEDTLWLNDDVIVLVDTFPMQVEYPMDVELCLDSDEAELSTGVTAAMFDQIGFYTIKWFDADGELPQYEDEHVINITLDGETVREFYFTAESPCGEIVQSRTATVAQKGIKDAEIERQSLELGEIICFDGTPFDLTYTVTLDLVNIIAGEETNIWMVDGVIQSETGTTFVYNIDDIAQSGTIITYGVVYGTCEDTLWLNSDEIRLSDVDDLVIEMESEPDCNDPTFTLKAVDINGNALFEGDWAWVVSTNTNPNVMTSNDIGETTLNPPASRDTYNVVLTITQGTCVATAEVNVFVPMQLEMFIDTRIQDSAWRESAITMPADTLLLDATGLYVDLTMDLGNDVDTAGRGLIFEWHLPQFIEFSANYPLFVNGIEHMGATVIGAQSVRTSEYDEQFRDRAPYRNGQIIVAVLKDAYGCEVRDSILVKIPSSFRIDSIYLTAISLLDLSDFPDLPGLPGQDPEITQDALIQNVGDIFTSNQPLVVCNNQIVYLDFTPILVGGVEPYTCEWSWDPADAVTYISNQEAELYDIGSDGGFRVAIDTTNMTITFHVTITDGDSVQVNATVVINIDVNKPPHMSIHTSPGTSGKFYENQVINYTVTPSRFDHYYFYKFIRDELEKTQTGPSQVFTTAFPSGGQAQFEANKDNLVIAVVEQNGCRSIGEVTVELLPVPSLLLPNDPDPLNRVLFPDFDIEVFDTWGLKLQSFGTKGWNATYNGRDVRSGTYYYNVRIPTEGGFTTVSGAITVLREYEH